MVSGTGERTIASSAALIIVVGLALSAAPAAYSATTPNPDDSVLDEATTQTTVDDVNDGDGDDEESPSPNEEQSETQTDTPSPTHSPEPEPTEPTEPNGSEPEGPPEPSLSCDDGGLIEPGQTETAVCTAVPSDLILSLGSVDSPFGDVSLEGSTLEFSAYPEVTGPQSVNFTVIATDDGVELDDQVHFVVEEASDGDTSPPPTVEPTPEPTPPDPEPTTTEPEPTTTSDTSNPTDPGASAPDSESPAEEEDAPVESESAESTAASPLPPPPGAPGAPSAEPSSDMFSFLPIPGMPRPENGAPEPTADSAAESADEVDGEDESEDDEGLLAQTGPEQVAWAGSLAATSIVLGTAALALARRQTQRRSGP